MTSIICPWWELILPCFVQTSRGQAEGTLHILEKIYVLFLGMNLIRVKWYKQGSHLKWTRYPGFHYGIFTQ